MEIRKTEPLWRQWNLIANFGQRDLKTKFKGSALGWLWSLVVPLATLAIYSVVFAIIFRAEPPMMGNGRAGIFVIWLFAGLSNWTFFSSTLNSGISALLGTGQLLQKVYFPVYAPVLGATVATAVQWGIEVGILLVVLAMLANVGWSWLLVPIWALLFLVFSASLAVVVSIMNVYFRDLAHLTSIALQLLFYMTPIIYPLTMVPDSWKPNFLGINWPVFDLQAILGLNPLTQFVELFRSLVYELHVGDWTDWLSLLVWTVVSLALSAFVVRRRGADLGESL